MRYLVKAKPLVLAFVALAVSDGAMAQPFKIGKPGTTTVTSTPITGNCANYNDQVSQHGAPLNGDHAGYCQFSSAQVLLNGVPFDHFWQAVSSGSAPPPYRVSFTSQLGEICASAQDLNIEVSMEIQTSRLDWPGAAAVGQACLNEWNRHNPATLISAPTGASAASVVQSLIRNLVASRLPRSIEACVSGRTASRTQAFAALATKIKRFMSPWVVWAQASVSADASGGECTLRCNLCSSGWAGTITLGKKFTKNNIVYFDETDTLYVGGTSSNPNRSPAEWTATGSGTYKDSSTTLNWSLNADVPGQCDPLAANASCLEAAPQPNGSILFGEPSSQVVVPTTIPTPCTGPGYQYTQAPSSGVPGPITCHQAGETQINAHGIGTMSPTTAIGSKTEMSCAERPPQNPGGYSCTQTWNWELYKQP